MTACTYCAQPVTPPAQRAGGRTVASATPGVRGAMKRTLRPWARDRDCFLTEPDGLVPLWAAFSAELITMDEPFLIRYPSVRVIVLS
jgi:hypothetical protein